MLFSDFFVSAHIVCMWINDRRLFSMETPYPLETKTVRLHIFQPLKWSIFIIFFSVTCCILIKSEDDLLKCMRCISIQENKRAWIWYDFEWMAWFSAEGWKLIKYLENFIKKVWCYRFKLNLLFLNLTLNFSLILWILVSS